MRASTIIPFRRALLPLSGLAALLAISPAIAADQPIAYIGEIRSFAFPFCPAGFVQANGQKLSVTGDYQPLYSLIGNTYGGSAGYSFNVPDFSKIGFVGSAPGLNTGDRFGSHDITLTGAQSGVAPHIHLAQFTPTKGTQTVTIPATTGTIKATPTLLGKKSTGLVDMKPGSYLSQGGLGTNAAPIYSDPTAAAGDVPLGGIAVAIDGNASTPAVSTSFPAVIGGTVLVNASASLNATSPIPIEPPALAMTMCIAYKGLFPAKN